MSDAITFVVGNTYNRIPNHKARLSRNGRTRKIYDVTVFVDILGGDPDTIERVAFGLGSSFKPQSFFCSTPIPMKSPLENLLSSSSSSSSGKMWRFKTRQQVYGAFTAEIKIRSTGGAVYNVSHSISLNRNAEVDAHRGSTHTFRMNSSKLLKMQKVPSTSRFGIELELTSVSHVLPQTIAEHVVNSNPRSNINVGVADSYSQVRIASSDWKIVPDSSIVCNRSQPDCNTFELVSPPLTSGNGLSNVSKVLRSLSTLDNGYSLKVNKSMGFHVHIDVSGFSQSQMNKICQQFVKYEEVLDTFMPPSRRSGSQESNLYFKSNRGSVTRTTGYTSNRDIHDALGRCDDISDLATIMNADGRYYKLNLQNLVTRRQSTIEFRQHSATMNYEKVGAWVRFCIAFCFNSAKLKEPTPFKSNRSLDEQFNCLFQYVVKDRALRNFYKKRQGDLNSSAESCNCCTACEGHSNPCASSF